MVICVTGPMAAGKNYVSSLIEQMSVDGKMFVSIDADIAGHDAVDGSALKIMETFGDLAGKKGIPLADENGKIIRRNLGALIFGNPELVSKQESIVYPKITSTIEKFIEENSGKNVIVNATVMFKIPLVKKMDAIIYVDCPWFIRLWRARKRDGMKLSQILARFRSQKNLYASYLETGVKVIRISNHGCRKRLQKKVRFVITNC